MGVGPTWQGSEVHMPSSPIRSPLLPPTRLLLSARQPPSTASPPSSEAPFPLSGGRTGAHPLTPRHFTIASPSIPSVPTTNPNCLCPELTARSPCRPDLEDLEDEAVVAEANLEEPPPCSPYRRRAATALVVSPQPLQATSLIGSLAPRCHPLRPGGLLLCATTALCAAPRSLTARAELHCARERGKREWEREGVGPIYRTRATI